jgi:hypothetical protein
MASSRLKSRTSSPMMRVRMRLTLVQWEDMLHDGLRSDSSGSIWVNEGVSDSSGSGDG